MAKGETPFHTPPLLKQVQQAPKSSLFKASAFWPFLSLSWVYTQHGKPNNGTERDLFGQGDQLMMTVETADADAMAI